MVVRVIELYVQHAGELLQRGNQWLCKAVPGACRLAVACKVDRKYAVGEFHPAIADESVANHDKPTGLLLDRWSNEVCIERRGNRVCRAGNLAADCLIKRRILRP